MARRNDVAAEIAAGGGRQGQGRSQDTGRGNDVAATESGYSGRGQGQGRGQSGGDDAVQPQAESKDHNWQTRSGVVADINNDLLLVELDSGAQIEISGRPWDFAQQAGFRAQAGDRVNLVGFDEEGEFEVGAFENVESGQKIQIREESGRPLWAGRGRRGQ